MKNFWIMALLVVGLLANLPVLAQQQDAKYFDEKGKRVSKEQATQYTIEEQINAQPPVVKSTTYFADTDAVSSVVHYTYNDGKKVREGEQKVWNKSGQLIRKANYKDGQLHDSLITHYDSGKIRRIEIYKAGKMKKGTVFAENGSTLPFQPSEQMPTFPGGERAMFDFISKSIKFSREAIGENSTGAVIMAFVVGEDGVIRDIKVKKGLRPDLDAESIRVIQSMPVWNPGIQNDKPVAVNYSIPIKFNLK